MPLHRRDASERWCRLRPLRRKRMTPISGRLLVSYDSFGELSCCLGGKAQSFFLCLSLFPLSHHNSAVH